MTDERPDAGALTGAADAQPGGSQRMRWQAAVIARIDEKTPRIKSFLLTLARPVSFVPGQHMDVRLVAPDGYEARRSYSIASAPESPQALELAMERLDGGEVSAFFHDEVKAADQVEVRGPIGGHFIWSVRDGGPVLMVGGGSGVVPFVSMIRHHAARQSPHRLILVTSARTAADLPYRDELIELERRERGFSLYATVTRESPAPPALLSGRIDRALLLRALQSLGAAPHVCFVCGSNGFVEAITAILADVGVPAARIRTERYGG